MEKFRSLFNIEENKSWKQFVVLKDTDDEEPLVDLIEDMLIDTRIKILKDKVAGEVIKLKVLEVYTMDIVLVELTKMAIVAGLISLEDYKD